MIPTTSKLIKMISNSFVNFCLLEYPEKLKIKIKQDFNLKQQNFMLQKKTENFITTLTLDNQLKKKQFEFLRVLYNNGSYRGLRHKRNLPTRGQRTHTNARTQKKLAKIRLTFKKKNESTSTI